ncbi:heme exporter protein CcmD [Falsiroseomonas tokyonensis]|uniref:Heme exporter protein D n=1 Tax=Falsiroseomonas tokyonensis TaxID=430521 RepID=A0ABV7BRH2_9PROT|nr:heme exporter protein CcmD [Falsiroseomonas tokyonensis]MBU8537144.1 heme exporter protein CcmD [Falsiroseomonas tokyonensis]
MTSHWIHITISWAGTLLVFASLAIAAVLRQRQAQAKLKRLDPRGERET